MTNPTSNFGWVMPTATDLVTDLPADFEVFGQAVDTSMADLKGGTTGQILSKATNADMDFTWVTNAGDIEGVTATTPLTGGGTTGTVTIGIQDATTAQKGAVQLTNSTASTSTTTAAVPANVKTAYDLAAGAIPLSTVTTNGDLIYGTGSSTVTRRGIGSTGQVLTVTGGIPTWETPTSGSMTLLATGTSTNGSSTVSISLSGVSSYKGVTILWKGGPTSVAAQLTMQINSASGYYNLYQKALGTTATNTATSAASNIPLYGGSTHNGVNTPVNGAIRFTNLYSTYGDYLVQWNSTFYDGTNIGVVQGTAQGGSSAALTNVTFTLSAGTFSNTGTVFYVYGVN